MVFESIDIWRIALVSRKVYKTSMKRLLILSILCLLSTQSWSQECISGNCVNGYGTYTYADGDKYVGEWGNGKRNGQGTYTYADGGKKAGIWGNSEYLGTIAEVKRKKQAEAEAKAKREKAEAEAKRKYDKIYNACLLDKSDGVDMSVRSLERAVKTTCEEIAKDPSWLESLKYN